MVRNNISYSFNIEKTNIPVTIQQGRNFINEGSKFMINIIDRVLQYFLDPFSINF